MNRDTKARSHGGRIGWQRTMARRSIGKMLSKGPACDVCGGLGFNLERQPYGADVMFESIDCAACDGTGNK